MGTGQALAMARQGDADIVLVHARRQEDAFMAAGYGSLRQDIMWNDFVLLGPEGDPAGIRGSTDVAWAMERIRTTKSTFVSRGDHSGTHTRELMLWEAAGGLPTDLNSYLEAGQGTGSCLMIADEKQAYLLADRGSYLAFSSRIQLHVMVEGDKRLHNPYGAILVNAERHPHVNADGARQFMEYLISPAGQHQIAAFRRNGKQLFHPVTQED